MGTISSRSVTAGGALSFVKRRTLGLADTSQGHLFQRTAVSRPRCYQQNNGWGLLFVLESRFARAFSTAELNSKRPSAPANSSQPCIEEAEKAVPVVKESRLLLDAFLKVRSETLLLPDGKTMDYLTVLSRPTAAVVLAFTPENKLVLTQEYRHPTGKYLLSSPGGLVDQNEDPLEAAARELREETGYEATDFAVIGESWPAPGIMEQKVIYVAAKNAVQKQVPELERGEMLCTCLKSLRDVRRDVVAGLPTDGILLTGLWYLEHNFLNQNGA